MVMRRSTSIAVATTLTPRSRKALTSPSPIPPGLTPVISAHLADDMTFAKSRFSSGEALANLKTAWNCKTQLMQSSGRRGPVQALPKIYAELWRKGSVQDKMHCNAEYDLEIPAVGCKVTHTKQLGPERTHGVSSWWVKGLRKNKKAV